MDVLKILKQSHHRISHKAENITLDTATQQRPLPFQQSQYQASCLRMMPPGDNPPRYTPTQSSGPSHTQFPRFPCPTSGS